MLWVATTVANLGAVERSQRRGIDDHLALAGLVFGRCQPHQRLAGQRVEHAPARIADEKAPRRPGRHGRLHRQADAGAARRRERGKGTHCLLHGKRRGRRTVAVVAVEPAGDCVAGKGDHAAAKTMYFVDHGVVDEVEKARQFLGAALCAQFQHQRLGQRGEARDVGEERGALRPVGKLTRPNQRLPPIHGDVGNRAVHRQGTLSTSAKNAITMM